MPCVLEKRLPLEGEFALTLARSPSGAISALPLVQNWHSGGILDQTRSPANVPALEAEAQRIAEHIIAALDYVGVLTVEFFLVGGTLLVNEMAPRPHTPDTPASTTPVAASSSCRSVPCAICRCRQKPRCAPPYC